MQVETHACYNTCCNTINNANEIPVSNARNVHKNVRINLVRGLMYMVYFSFKSILFLCIDTGKCWSNEKLL